MTHPSSSTTAALLRAGFSVALILMTSVGCVVGPDYVRPGVGSQVPAAFDAPEGWKIAAPADDSKITSWWRRFGDTQLDGFIVEATGNNQDLVAAYHRVEMARAITYRTRAEWLPSIDFDPSARRAKRSVTVSNTSSNLAGITTTNLALPLVIDYEIDLWGKLRRAIEASEAEYLASESTYRQVVLTLQTEIASRYFELRAADAEITIFEKALGLRRKSLDLNQQRLAAGDTDEVDVSRAETELSSTETELIAIRQNREQIENAIAVLLGRPSSGFHISSNPLHSVPPKFPLSVPSELLERRPDIAAAERIMIAENARIGVAKAAFFPTVRLIGTVGLESGSISKLFNYSSRAWGLGPEITFPVFDGGKNQSELARSEARYDETVAIYRQSILKAIREVDDSLVGIERLAQQAASQNRTIAAAGRTVDLSRQRYDAGVVAYFEVVDAQRTELDAQQGAVRIRAARHLAAISLVKALGGDWE